MRKILLAIILLILTVGCVATNSELDEFIKNYNKAVGDTGPKIDRKTIGDILEDERGKVRTLYEESDMNIITLYDKDENITAYSISIFGDIEDHMPESKAIVQALNLDEKLFDQQLETLLESGETFHNYEDKGKTMTLSNFSTEESLYVFQFRKKELEE